MYYYHGGIRMIRKDLDCVKKIGRDAKDFRNCYAQMNA